MYFIEVLPCRGQEVICLEFNNGTDYTLLQCAHIDINYTDRGCITCGEKQEMHYHRYLSLYSLVVVAPSLSSFQKPQKTL